MGLCILIGRVGWRSILEGSPSSFLPPRMCSDSQKGLETLFIYPAAGRAWIQFRPNNIIGSNNRMDSDAQAPRN